VHRAGARWGLRVQGTSWGEADDEATLDGTVVSSTSGGITDVSRPVLAQLSSESSLWDAGAGLWVELCQRRCLTVVAGVGVRFAALDETARMSFVTTDAGPTPAEDGFAQADVANDLLLGELMLGLRWAATDRCNLMLAVTGLYGSTTTDIEVQDEDVFTSGLHASSRSEDDTVTGVQLDMLAQWRAGNGWSLGLGYSLLWLDGVQRGPSALDFGQSETGAVQAAWQADSYTVHAVLLGVSIDF
jgi:hypothetical protein